MNSKALFAIGSAVILTACLRLQTTPPEKIHALVAEGCSITWSHQAGEYWDAFRARKGKLSKTFLVNRRRVSRSSGLEPGDANQVELTDGGRMVVTTAPEGNQEPED